jgi:hypothetical protein
MSAMMFAYVEARQAEIERQSMRPRLIEAPSMRDRVGRTLIAWGQQLVASPPATSRATQSVRRAA